MSAGRLRVLIERLSSVWRCESGVTAVEFAFLAPLTLAILLAIVQVSVVYIAQSYLETVTEDAMRVVLTNQSYSLTQSGFNSAVCSKVVALFDCNKIVVNLQPITATNASGVSSALPTFDSSGNLSSTTTFNPGVANDKMLLVVMYQWPVIAGPFGLTFSNMGNGTRLLVSTEVFYKEPCLDASACKFTG